MARMDITNSLDDDDLNAHQNNYKELYAGMTTAKAAEVILDNFLNGTGVVTNKMLAELSVSNSKLGDKVVHHRNIADLAVREHHLAAMSATERVLATGAVTNTKMADYSISNAKLRDKIIHNRNIADLAVSANQANFDEVTINRNKTYPLLNAYRDGELYTITDEIRASLLSVKVYGAEKDKYYAIRYIANGISGHYGISLVQYDKNADGSFLRDSMVVLTRYDDLNGPAYWSIEPAGPVVHRTVFIEDKGLTFEIIYDKSEIILTGLDFSNTLSGKAFGSVIHPNNYVYKSSIGKVVENAKDKIALVKQDGKLFIYKPTSNGNYVGHELSHYSKPVGTDVNSNYDLYQVRTIKEYSRSGNTFNVVRPLLDDSTPTTMDLMLRESADMDYMGGINHGDEVNQFITLIVDGKEVDMTTNGFYEADEVRLIQRNNLYRDSVYTGGILEQVATVGKEHIFNMKDGYILANTVKWIEAINIYQAFMGALTMNRSYSGSAPIWKSVMNDITFVPFDISVTGGSMPSAEDVEKVTIVGDNLVCTIVVERHTRIPGNNTYVANFAEGQSKLYISYAPNRYTTSVDEVWKQKTKFNFDFN